MFRKLRLQLILINSAIIALLFLVLTVGSYAVLETQMNKRAEFMIDQLASDIASGNIKKWPPGPPRHIAQAPPAAQMPPPLSPFSATPPLPTHHEDEPVVFFVKTDRNGNVHSQSHLPTNAINVPALVHRAMEAATPTGKITLDQRAYVYAKKNLTDQSGLLFIFQSVDHEKRLLHLLITVLIITGVICLLLSFLASLFMANRAMIPIRKAWQQQKDFLADASHELRTPLAVIQTNLEIVLDNQELTVASQNKWLNNIKEESVMMSTLVDSLLFLAQADSQQQLLKKTSFSLKHTILRAIKPFNPIAAGKQISIDTSLADNITLYGDETIIRRLISIFLDNAVKHTPTAGKISVTLDQSNQQAIIIIADTGEGIAPEHLDKIFDRFYQVDKARSRGGVGLGLAIAKWIVESHNGRIIVNSSLHKGTAFTIYFPLQAPSEIN